LKWLCSELRHADTAIYWHVLPQNGHAHRIFYNSEHILIHNNYDSVAIMSRTRDSFLPTLSKRAERLIEIVTGMGGRDSGSEPLASPLGTTG